MRHNHPKPEKNRGSILLLATFVLLTTSILSLSFLKSIQVSTKSSQLKKKKLQAYYAARSGIEEAIAELRLQHAWVSGNAELSPQWNFGPDSTFYKSTHATTPLTHFDYPTTISVQVLGDPKTDVVQISSIGSVGMATGSAGTDYHQHLIASVIFSVANEAHIRSIQEK